MSSIETKHEYEQREAREFQRQLRDAERNPSRRADAADFREQLAADPALVAERIGWLLNGSYGYGAMVAAKGVLSRKRMNRVAWLVQTVGALEWRCPRAASVKAWKSLSPSEKRKLAVAVKRAIKAGEEHA